MAYRYEKEENGQYAIVIDGWEAGVATDPYSGINRMNTVNLNTPGEISVGYPITINSRSGGTLGNPIADSTRYFPTLGTPGGGVPDGSVKSFAILDATGQVWESATGSSAISGTWTRRSASETTVGASSNDGVAYFLGYLFKTRGANIDYWTGAAWTNAWQTTLAADVKHFMYVATNNVLYITNGNYLASITAVTPAAFDPGSGATYAFSTTKLQLPVTDTALSLAETGSGNSPQSTLLIGGSQNAIYPWDKLESSFALPIYVADSYIKNMVSVNQNVFIFPGNQQGRGRIYVTNGSQADLYFKMPDYIYGEQDPYFVWGDAIFHRNNLLFSCFVTQNGGGGNLLFSEVYAIDLDTKAFRSVSSLSSSTGAGSATCLISSSVSSPGLGYVAAWQDGGSQPQIGYSGTAAGIGIAVVNTDLIPVGSFTQKGTFSQVEYKLRTPLQSGESISVIPIIDGSTLPALVFSPTVTTGVISGYAIANIQNAQWMQFQISMTGNSATSGCRLKELRIR